MEQAFYTKINELVATLNVKKQNKYLIKTDTYNEVVKILQGTEKKRSAAV